MGQILYHTALLAPSLQDADPWSIVRFAKRLRCVCLELHYRHSTIDLGSVRLCGAYSKENSNYTWLVQKGKFMSRRPGREMQKVYIGHLRWLQDQGPSYKQQAASCKRQAASLTRDLYCVIGYSRRKKYENK